MIPVKPHIAEGSRVSSLDAYREEYARSLAKPEEFWREKAQRLSWFRQPERTCEYEMRSGSFEWFGGGTLNACYNCVDRHLEARGEQTAIIWAKDEPGEYEHISYAELARNVARTANLLTSLGVRRGDRVCIYLPMIPELAYTMLACARIGAIHSVVFAGFSAEALRERIVDAGCRIVVTANEGLRGGRTIPLKATTDAAVDTLEVVEKVIVVSRTETEVPMREGRDVDYGAAMATQRPVAPVEHMDAESPLFILYTSGSTGKPKGVAHTTGGYLVYASLTHELVFDLRPDDVYFCAADIGWITGHSYIVYGPLANGATTVMFESTPVYPDSGRYWRVIDDLDVTIFYTAPTAIRAIARAGDEIVKKYDRSSLRILGTVGEPINPEVWNWYHDVCGDGRCAVVDTWWQTETGGILITPLPGATPAKPGARPRCPCSASSPCSSTRMGRRSRATTCVESCASSDPGRARPVPSGGITSDSSRPTTRPSPACTSRATDVAATRMATTGSPGASTTCSTFRGTGSARPRSRALSSPTTRSPRRRSWASPTTSRAPASTPTCTSRVGSSRSIRSSWAPSSSNRFGR